MGKVFRLKKKGLNDRDRPKRAPARPRRNHHARSHKPKAGKVVVRQPILLPEVPPAVPVEGGVPIMELQSHHCRSIIGHGKDGLARYCGAEISPRLMSGRVYLASYCGPHCDEYYTRR